MAAYPGRSHELEATAYRSRNMVCLRCNAFVKDRKDTRAPLQASNRGPISQPAEARCNALSIGKSVYASQEKEANDANPELADKL